MKSIAKQILQLIDLTSLNDSDSEIEIKDLCDKAITNLGNVPAICIYSHFIPLASKLLKNTNIKIATVANFPSGLPDLEKVIYETNLALERGADEVDIVFPYHELMKGHYALGEKMVKAAKEVCGSNKTLKVIIESGILNKKNLIREACQISIQNGADFVKTSTGKVAINATLEAAEVILEVIKTSNAKCGIKIAGGVKTIM